MPYKQLTQEQRYQIYAFIKAGFTQKQIAREISVHPSTVSRELKRNRGGRGYRPKQAHEMAATRKHVKPKKRILPTTWEIVDAQLSEQWSPEQIAGYLKRHNQQGVSHEWIYQHIWHDKRAGGTLYQHLRCQKQRRKRYGTNSKRGLIANRCSIEQRPAVVDSRARVGDWEADTIIGKAHQQAIVTIVERKTGYCLMQRVSKKTAQQIQGAACQLLLPVKECVHTITSDNGREFANHATIAACLSADFYFAHPYHSWERGTNENTNGLIRQYFPKKTDFSQLSVDEVLEVQEKLNNRPRKRLGYQTPKEVFFKEQEIALTN